MPSSPATPGVPKYVLVAEQIEARILAGEWDGGRLPSVRDVAATHRVSVVTASRALQVLRDKGLIQTVERSGCYRVPAAGAERWMVCLNIPPGPWQAAILKLVHGGFEQLARRLPMHLELDSLDLPAGLSTATAEAALRAAQAAGVQGLVLLPTCAIEALPTDLALVTACRSVGLPVVLLERNLWGQNHLSNADLVAVDDAAGALETTQHLLATGRKRVGIMVAAPMSSHDKRLAGYLLALHQASRTPDFPFDPQVLMMQAAADWLPARLADWITEQRLDGVLCSADNVAVELIHELHTRGVAVPDRVAVAGFGGLPLPDSFQPSLTTYQYPAEEIADRAVRLLRERVSGMERPFVKVIVPGQLIVRASTTHANSE